MDAPFKTIGEVNAYEENEVVKIQARGLPEATQKKRIRDRDRDRVGIRATALRDRDRASIEVGASYAASLVLVLVSLFSIGQATKVSGWTVLGRFYSHLAFCNYFLASKVSGRYCWYQKSWVSTSGSGARYLPLAVSSENAWYHTDTEVLVFGL